jgi:hypothetical protein
VATDFNILKKAMIEALEKSLGVVTTAAKAVGIDRSTHYGWYNNDPEYRAAVDSISDIALDFAESQLHKQIKGGEVSSTIFYLKTKGKKRGYVERTEVEHSGELGVTWLEEKTYEADNKTDKGT